MYLYCSLRSQKKNNRGKKIKFNGGQEGVSKKSAPPVSIVGDGIRIEEELNLVGVKRKLKDYEQMLQHYTLMKMKNKMKDFEIESEEWLEVVKEYFTKELKKNLPQHKANEKF